MAAAVIVITCGSCNKEQPPLNVDHFSLKKWRDGMKAQDAFPYLNNDERELLISGTCGTCFDRMFGG